MRQQTAVYRKQTNASIHIKEKDLPRFIQTMIKQINKKPFSFYIWLGVAYLALWLFNHL